MDDTFSGADFSAAASATASPEASSPEPVSAPETPDSTPVSTDTTEPAATVQASQTVPVSEKPKPGEPPQDKWPTILDNARANTRKEVEKEWEPYAWAKTVPREALAEMTQIANRMHSDPIGFLSDFVKDLEAHPTHSQALRSHAGRILSSGRQQPSVDLSPDVDVYGDNGQIVAKTFSAERMQAIVQKAVQEAIGKEVQPLKSEREQRLAREKAETQRAAIAKQADAIWNKAKGWTGFTEHAAEIDSAMAQHPDWTLHDAYIEVVVPNLSKTERVKVLADLSAKPAASTVSPASGTTSTPKPDSEKSWEELFREKYVAAGR